MISKKGVAIQKVMVFVLAMTAVFIVFFYTLGPEGRVQMADERIDDLQSVLSEFARQRDGILSREGAAINPGLLDSWASLYENLLLAKQSDEYCIIPFKRYMFSERENIELIQSSEGVVLRVNFASGTEGHSNLYELRLVENLNLYVGQFSSHNNENIFSPITKSQVDRIKTVDFICPEIDGNINCESTLEIYQPLHTIGYDSLMNPVRFDSIFHGAIEGNMFDSFILANNEQIVFLKRNIESSFVRSESILSEFTSTSGIDGSTNGYRFCNPRDEMLLAPRSGNLGDCNCALARNPAMCNSLTKDNCGIDCAWTGGDYDGEQCSADDTIRPFYRAMVDVFAELMSREVNSVNGCWDYAVLSKDDIPDVPPEDLGNMVRGLNFAKQGSNLLIHSSNNDMTIQSQETFPDTSISFYDDDSSYLSFSMDGRQRLRINNRVGRNDQAFSSDEDYIFYAKIYPDEVVFSTRTEFENKFNDGSYDMNFCNSETPYFLGLIDSQTECKDIRNIETCIIHNNYYDGIECHWRLDKRNLIGNIFTIGLGNTDECRSGFLGALLNQNPRDILNQERELVRDFFSDTSTDGCFSYDDDVLRGRVILTSKGDDLYLSLYSSGSDNWMTSERWSMYFISYIENAKFYDGDEQQTLFEIPSLAHKYSFETDAQGNSIITIKGEC